jgi:hypothetical protein
MTHLDIPAQDVWKPRILIVVEVVVAQANGRIVVAVEARRHRVVVRFL